MYKDWRQKASASSSFSQKTPSLSVTMVTRVTEEVTGGDKHKCHLPFFNTLFLMNIDNKKKL